MILNYRLTNVETCCCDGGWQYTWVRVGDTSGEIVFFIVAHGVRVKVLKERNYRRRCRHHFSLTSFFILPVPVLTTFNLGILTF
jgi:hypothetical protein